MNQIAKIVVRWEMCLSETPVSYIAQHLPISRDTAHRWIREIKKRERIPELFLDDYLATKKGPRKRRKIDGLLKKRIWNIKKTIKAERTKSSVLS